MTLPESKRREIAKLCGLIGGDIMPPPEAPIACDWCGEIIADRYLLVPGGGHSTRLHLHEGCFNRASAAWHHGYAAA